MAKDITWTTLDPRSLDQDLAKAYQDYKDAYNYAKTLKQGFEAKMREKAQLPEGKLLLMAYNFGKLSVAVVEDDRKPKAAPKGTPSLSEWLAQQR